MRAVNSIRLHPRMRALDAFIALGDEGLVAIADLLDALHRRDHPDDVHELRVAVRHLRAVCWAFGPVLPRTMRARWQACLRQLARAASEVRDWDVFIAETLQPALDLQPEDPVLAAVRDVAVTRRHAVRETMVAQLAEYQRWPLPVLHRDLTHLGGNPRSARAAARARLGEFAPRRVSRADKRVRALARAAKPGDLERVHRYRIGSKRLRYVIESLMPVLPKRQGKRLHRKLVRRQRKLGNLVDGAVARRLMAQCLDMAAADAPAADRSATISP